MSPNLQSGDIGIEGGPWEVWIATRDGISAATETIARRQQFSSHGTSQPAAESYPSMGSRSWKRPLVRDCSAARYLKFVAVTRYRLTVSGRQEAAT